MTPNLTLQDLPNFTDLVLLRPGTTLADLEAACGLVRGLGLHGITLPGSQIAAARHFLEDLDSKVAAVVGFPWGTTDADVKRYETEAAIDAGAHEIEAVPNLGWLKEGRDDATLRELRDLIEAADERPLRVILETTLLSTEQVLRLSALAREAGASGVQSSSGLGDTGIAHELLHQIRATIGPRLSIKASGGIRLRQTAHSLLEAGATRLGILNAQILALQDNPPPPVA